MNKELLDNWTEHEFFTDNGKWTLKAKKLIPITVRNILLDIFYGKKIKYHYQIVKLSIYKFDEKGFYYEKKES